MKQNMLDLRNTLNPDKLYFVSDTHFYHKNIIKFTNRPFDNIHEMNKTLIENWNKKVPKDGIVFHLGDFGFGAPGKIKEIIKQLNGTIVLIAGNHEKTVLKKEDIRNMFHSIHKLLEINVSDIESKNNTRKLTLCHYPLESWNKSHFGINESIHLHGHWHYDNHRVISGRVDIGVDNKFNYLTPWCYEDVIDYFLNFEYIELNKSYNKNKSKYSFELSDKEIKTADDIMKKQISKVPTTQTAIGGRFSFEFTQTGVGIFSSLIDHETDESFVITDYDKI